jgi:hypothetical protein
VCSPARYGLFSRSGALKGASVFAAEFERQRSELVDLEERIERIKEWLETRGCINTKDVNDAIIARNK